MQLAIGTLATAAAASLAMPSAELTSLLWPLAGLACSCAPCRMRMGRWPMS